jgi:crossover junction endodeoxyribonuclease RuvC
MWIGIDPGESGGIAIIEDTSNGVLVMSQKLDATEADVSEFLERCGSSAKFCLIEKVGATPQMGVVSAFTFGRSFGFLIGLLTAHKIPFDFVTPQKWQKSMGCLTGGDKNVSKGAAQRLFPSVKMTHANADSILLAEHCRRTHP